MSSHELERKFRDAVDADPRRIDPAFMTDDAEQWQRTRTLLSPAVHALKSGIMGEMELGHDENGDLTSTVYVAVAQPKGRAYVLGFKDFITLASKAQQHVAPLTLTDGVGYSNAKANLELLLSWHKDPRAVLHLAEQWRLQQGKTLLLGCVDARAPVVPLVAGLRLVGSRLHMKVLQHRNLEGGTQEFSTTVGTIFKSACGAYLKLTYNGPFGPARRFVRVQGGLQPGVFDFEPLIFDLSELPKD